MIGLSKKLKLTKPKILNPLKKLKNHNKKEIVKKKQNKMLQLNKRKTHQTSIIANRKRLKLIQKKVMTARKVQRRKKRLLRKNLLK